MSDFRERLAREERLLARRLFELEGRVRQFEDSERPAFESWMRLELGPFFSTLEELHEQIRARRILALRVDELVRTRGLHPREALFVALTGEEKDAEAGRREGQPREHAWDEDEIEARRQAKRESKRAARKEERAAKRKQVRQEEELAQERSRGPISLAGESETKRGPTRLIALYRTLARKLHPDSSEFLKELPLERARSLWHEVQSAYDDRSVERLLAIAVWLGEEGRASADLPALSPSERKGRIRMLERSCRKIEERLGQLRSHPAWEFCTLGKSALRKLRQRLAREMQEELERTRDVLDQLEDFIDSIGPPCSPRAQGGRKGSGKSQGRGR